MNLPKVNYLNNRDILKEIHKSKNTYCSFRDPQTDHQYDVIVDDIKKIDVTKIKEAQQSRADRIKRETGTEIDSNSIDSLELVFRLMTWDHIPMVPKKLTKAQVSKKKKLEELLEFDTEVSDLEEDPDVGISDNVHARVNFPPFQHYRFDTSGQLVLVGKSHWKGDLINGEFSKDHGTMTPKLAQMFVKLCERYATRSNWRGYTYNEEMRGQALLQLSQIGLQFDESKSQNPFAYYTAAITNSFTRILNIEKKMQNIRDDILEMNGLNPSWTRQMSNTSSGTYEE